MHAKHIGWIIIGIIVVVILSVAGKLIETLPASDVMVIQYPSGKLEAFTQPGIYPQYMGTVTHYPKRESFEVEDQKITFNDGGTATITGSVQFDVPTDPETLIAMHSKFYSPDTVKAKLIQPAFIKAVYSSGPMVSSRESYAERRTELQNAIDDQMANGLYKIRPVTTSIIDPISKETKTIIKNEIVRDDKGQPIYAAQSTLAQFGVKTFGLTISDIKYDPLVQKQIQQQQDIIMAVQTAQANSRKADQDALTAEAQGRAKAATATWDQKAKAATATTAAQQALDVATLDAKSAEQEKAAAISRGQGASEARKLLLAADNALTQRLDAWKYGQQVWADAFSKYKGPALVPSVVTGGAGNANAGLTPQDIMNGIGVRQYQQLALDANMAPEKK